MDFSKMETPFHPLVWQWFSERFSKPTAPQKAGWDHISQGRDTLIAAPTGSGKTLAAFLWAIDRLVREAAAGKLQDKTSVVYVSPLKALGNDIEKNLREPLAGITRLAGAAGLNLPQIRVAVRSGDTPSAERRLMVRRPPHILITTPESLYILLTAERSRRILRCAQTVIADEIHAVAGDKRGAHLALSLERLDALVQKPLQRIGLSATQKPVEEVARLLVGAGRLRDDGTPRCAVVDIGHRRDLKLSIELPEQELGPITKHEIWAEVYDRIAGQVRAHRTTLVFVNTRRLAERVAHQLTARLGEDKVGAHHGSLSRESRIYVEEKLKSGELPVVVATASLELGIDIGHIDLVCHIGSPRTLATLLQRVGRSGHWLGATPKGALYPLTRDDLVQCLAAVRAVHQGELDCVTIPENPLDVLAQQIVATVASVTPSPKAQAELPLERQKSGLAVEDLWQILGKAYPYRNLAREEFEQLLDMLSDGVANRRGRRSAYLHHDRVHGVLRARRGARLSAITNGGAIPDTADYDVIEVPHEGFVGKVNEDFAIESLAGDIFLLGNRSWRIRRVSSGKVWVEDARGAPPTIPFWLGEAPARTLELSRAVSELRHELARRLNDPVAAIRWLVQETGAPEAGAEQMVQYLQETRAMLGCVPTMERIVAERFFDEAGGMQLVLHAPFGGRINRAWGMALRKRFCVSFDRELQAAATDDGVVLSLGEQHSFPLKDVFGMISFAAVHKVLVQAALASPMFTNRWRWDATRALALLRYSGGKKIPMMIQRIRAEELLAAVFPEQIMCQDNRVGPVELPDHPLVQETIKDCLHEAMDVEGLKRILKEIEQGQLSTVAVDTPAPSPMAHEILNANPYAFLDDAPLEERRARAVSLRRIDADLAQGLGVLDPEAIEQVRSQAWPDIRNADELHDLLLGVNFLPVEEAEPWWGFGEALIQCGRATVAVWRIEGADSERRAYVAAERLSLARAVHPRLQIEPEIRDPTDRDHPPLMPEEAVKRTVRGWMDLAGPIVPLALARRLGLSQEQVKQALLSLESDGIVLRGKFTQPAKPAEEEWCERGLLARIHRRTLSQLRREIEPVAAADFIRFLLSWQHVQPGTQLRGREGLLEVIGQLQGLELSAPAWERDVLPARVSDYEPADLDSLCLSGFVTWGRLRSDPVSPARDEEGDRPGRKSRRMRAPTRVAPISLILRENLSDFLAPIEHTAGQLERPSQDAREVIRYLEEHGASFLSDIAAGTGLLKTKTEEALWELVARGLVTGDGIAGLRVLLTPEVKRRPRRRGLRLISGGRTPERLMPVGRWSLWRTKNQVPGATNKKDASEFLARQLLRRFGVVFREVLTREINLPPWRKLLEIYRRLEARGEIRGGQFVRGYSGEQFALAEAVEILRAVRRSSIDSNPVIVSAADPLNVVGILTPGPRLSPYSNQFIIYHNGVPVDVGALGAVRSRLGRTGVGSRQ